MDRREIDEIGRQAMRQKLQSKSLSQLLEIANERKIPVPALRWFPDPKQATRVRARKEAEYKTGLIEWIVGDKYNL